MLRCKTQICMILILFFKFYFKNLFYLFLLCFDDKLSQSLRFAFRITGLTKQQAALI